MQESNPSVVLPSIQFLLEDVARYEATNRISTTPPALKPLRVPVNHTLRPPFPHPPRVPQSTSPSASHPPSRLPASHPSGRFHSSYAPASQRPFPHHDQDRSMGQGSYRSSNTFPPLPRHGSSSFATTGPLAVSYYLPTVVLGSLSQAPQPQHLPTFNFGRALISTTQDHLLSQATDLQPSQAIGPPPVPPRPLINPTLVNDTQFASDFLAGSPRSPSLLLSPSIEGSPTRTPGQLPFPLVPVSFIQPASQEPLPEPQIAASGERGGRTKSDRAPLQLRVDGQITKNGTMYSRCRPDYLLPPPGQGSLARRTWKKWEHSAASEALVWYKTQNPRFDLLTSTQDEQRINLPVVFEHITAEYSECWRRTYDGFLTWAAKAKARPTTRKPANRGLSTVKRPARTSLWTALSRPPTCGIYTPNPSLDRPLQRSFVPPSSRSWSSSPCFSLAPLSLGPLPPYYALSVVHSYHFFLLPHPSVKMLTFSPGSFVCSSSSSTNATVNASHELATRVSMPPWIQPVHNPLPCSLYPILPPPTPYYARTQPLDMLRSYSTTSTDDDTGEGEDIDGTPLDSTTFANCNIASSNNGNGGFEASTESDIDGEYCSSESEFDPESEDETLDIIRASKALAIKKKKNTMKAAQAVAKRTSPKRTARATKTCNKTTTSTSVEASTSDSDSPAKRTRSSTRSQKPKAQITGYHKVEVVPLQGTQKFKTRKTWIPEDKAVLKVAVRRWWRAVGAARYNYPTTIVLPKKRSDECWGWMWSECKKSNEKFNRNERGLASVAQKMSDSGLI
ncbi:hypothetical protein M407DRAFT_22862 [Tulasnella calospora MUT 4182]|uniref:Uncharacterized protein n=1 Tax=Tulasnella calospora MUT 4182 TaxID=1051891 RepID=A0A0C3QMB5_9AGAM|nr:hypothetical protein M407DRAFT_22862 [Tulasnella calospora MUT 4182]